jgi:hypothetical protein
VHATHPRHQDIGNNQVLSLFTENPDPIIPIAHIIHFISFAFQHVPEYISYVLIIINNKNSSQNHAPPATLLYQGLFDSQITAAMKNRFPLNYSFILL